MFYEPHVHAALTTRNAVNGRRQKVCHHGGSKHRDQPADARQSIMSQQKQPMLVSTRADRTRYVDTSTSAYQSPAPPAILRLKWRCRCVDTVHGQMLCTANLSYHPHEDESHSITTSASISTSLLTTDGIRCVVGYTALKTRQECRAIVRRESVQRASNARDDDGNQMTQNSVKLFPVHLSAPIYAG